MKFHTVRRHPSEGVAKVYPEFVIRDQSGRIDCVRYDELAPVLLNEVQKQRAQLDAQQSTLQDLKEEVAQLKKINAAMQVALAQVRLER